MVNTTLMDSLGLSMTTLFSSLGKTAAENFPQICDVLSKGQVTDTETIIAVAEGFKLWCITCQLPTKPTLLQNHAERLFEAIVVLTTSEDESSFISPENGNIPYKGDVYAASILTEALDTISKMDTTEELISYFAPLAMQSVDKILNHSAALTYANKIDQKISIASCRNEVICVLLTIYPCNRDIKLPQAISVVNFILHGVSFPDEMKARARALLIALGSIDRESIINASSALMEMFRADITGEVLQVYITVPEVYFANPAEVHNNLPLFFQREYHLTGLLFKVIADRHPEVLLPHISFFVDKITQPSFGALSLHIITAIAALDPDAVYPLKSDILAHAASVPASAPMVCTLLTQVAHATSSVAVADEIFADLLRLLEQPDTCESLQANVLHAMASVLSRVTDIPMLVREWPKVEQCASASEVVFHAMDEFVKDRAQSLGN